MQFIKNKLESLASGSTFKEVSKRSLRKLKLPLPPLPEQQKIAEILSTVDESIKNADDAIVKTQKLKKGLMQQLLTKGIGHTRFKQTEIGEIPDEWGVVRLGEVCEVKGGKRLPKGHKLLDGKTEFPYVRVIDFKKLNLDINNIKYLTVETQKQIKNYTISKDDVYISIAGTIGLAGLIPEELDGANLTENAAKLCSLRSIAKEFLAYFLSSDIGQRIIKEKIIGTSQPKLALFRIRDIVLPLPPLLEQQKIAEILSRVDEKIEVERKRKEKLERLKKGFMQDLLTGKVRVKV